MLKNMNRLVLFLAALAVPFTALAEAPASGVEENPKLQMTMGDLPDSAFTNRAGTFVLHPIASSALSISDNVELKTSVLGLIGGPNLSAEIALVQTPDMAVSLEPGLSSSWGFGSYNAGINANFSTHIAGPHFFSAHAGAGYGYHGVMTITDTAGNEVTIPAGSTISVPVSVNFDIQSDPYTIWDFYAVSDAVTLATAPVKTGSIGFNWYHSFGGFRLGLGVDLVVGTIPAEVANALKAAGVTPPPLAVFPLPDVTLGWKF
jgi:hypothetical protein